MPNGDAKTLLVCFFEGVWENIKALTNTELFVKKYFLWIGNTSLGTYVVSATSSHYDWGLKLIAKCSR